MIKNERQYRISRTHLEKFEAARARIEKGEGVRPGTHPTLVRAQADAMRSQIEELREEIAEYEVLASGKRTVFALESFNDLPKALIRARIATGLSQRELAERLGVKEQQIQRYEATDYASASMSRIREVLDALRITLQNTVVLPQADLRLKDLLAGLRRVGIPTDFVSKRLAPPSLTPYLKGVRNSRDQELNAVALQLADRLSRIFHWNCNQVLAGEELKIAAESLGIARFKARAGAGKPLLTAYAVYAHYLALLVLQVTKDLTPRRVSSNAGKVREQILSSRGSVNFDGVLNYVWDLGIPVLPLDDPGTFHGACWRLDGRNIIVLKQNTNSQARWVHDLLHELYHAGKDPGKRMRTVIELDEDGVGVNHNEEVQAGIFAGNVVLDGRAETLAEMCVAAAGGSVECLKRVLPEVALRENVPVDALANYMAFRLSLQRIDWWGAATNLQPPGRRPFLVARDLLLSRLDLSPLTEVDRELLLRAVTNEED